MCPKYRLLLRVILFILPLSITQGLAQDYLFNIEHLTPDVGLADLQTTAIAKDSKGFLWIGTYNGLNRYDGYNFLLYQKELKSFSQKYYIKEIQEDDDGLLWIFYSSGLHRSIREYWSPIVGLDIFDPKTNRGYTFEDLFKEKAPFQLSDITLVKTSGATNQVWITTGDGAVYCYQNGNFRQFYYQKGFNCHSIKVDEEQNLWLASGKEVIKFNKSGKKLDEVKIETPDFISSIWLDESQRLIINTEPDLKNSTNRSQHFFVKDTSLEAFYFYEGDKDNLVTPIEVPHRIFNHRDKNGFYYCKTTQDGIHIFTPEGKWIKPLNELLSQKNSTILAALEGENYTWLATSNGLIKINVHRNPFRQIKVTKSLADSRGITGDEQGNIYFLTSGLYQWHPNNVTYKLLNRNETEDGVGGTAHVLLKNGSELFYTSYRGNLFNYDISTHQSKYPKITGQKAFQATSLFFNKTTYLIGTKNGLYFFDPVKEEQYAFDQYNEFGFLRNISINHLYLLDKKMLVATENGIFLLEEGKGITHHFSETTGDLPFDNIQHIIKDQEAFWLASGGGGLIRWEVDWATKTTTYRAFTTKDGLSNNYIYAAYQDEFNNLWLPSDKGLMCFDKSTFEVRTYLRQDGLLHNEFNFASHYQAPDGTLYFGGLGGIIAFHPKDFVSTTEYNTPLLLTRFSVLEKDAENVTDKTLSLNKNEKITIRPSDKFLELEFALLDFEEEDQHLYAYKIEGYSDAWNYSSDGRLRITHLPYGRYNLRIKGKNVNEGWTQQELLYQLNVVRPFYLQSWFLIMLLLLIGGAIYAYIKWRELKLIQTQERLEEQVKLRTLTIQQQSKELQELDKAKTRFFSNVTHEFRTPLTLIIGPLERILQSKAEVSHRPQLLSVLKNARQLLTLINQMLDLSKLEGQKMGVEITHGDIVKYTRELTKRFMPLAERKEQTLTFSTNCTEWKTHFDKNKWHKIIYNLVSNAIKYTPKGKSIEIQLNEIAINAQQLIQLKVQDKGVGINKENLQKIFNRFYQVDSASTRVQGGTGIGLSLVKELVELQGGIITAESEVGKGTTFTVHLPPLNAKGQEVQIEQEEEVLMPVEGEESPIVRSAAVPLISDDQKLKLLLIEDNDEMRAYIADCLDPAKYHIIEARDGEEGIAKAKEVFPDLIILDIMMPKKNGYDVVREIRSTLATSHIPIVLLTAKSSLESRLEGFKRGADAYLTKPFSPQELALRIQKLIEIRRLLQNRYREDDLPVHSELFEQEDKFVLELKSFIQENLNNPALNSDTIGKHFGISRTGLYNKIKALTGLSIGEHIRNIRMKTAYQLLQEGKSNISDIAYQTGFSSLSHFSRTFKKVYEQPPSSLISKSEPVK